MPQFKKGHKKVGGRVAGQPNKSTIAIKELLQTILPPAKLQALWLKKLDSRDEAVASKAFEMAVHYLYGKPVQAVGGDEDAPPIRIDISAIRRPKE